MSGRDLLLAAGAALCLTLPGGATRADAAFAEAYAALLEQGDIEAAIALATEAAGDAPADGQAQFALGAGQFLLAVERLGHGLYRYGLASEYRTGMAGGLVGLPVLRLPVPPNPAPDPVTYKGLRELLDGFVTDLATANDTLAQVGPEPFDLPLDMALVRIDIDGDGKVSRTDSLPYYLMAVSGMAGMGTPDMPDFLVDFDQSDAPWLQGYCHLLSAMASFPLAHDWEAAYEATFHDLFPAGEMAGAGIRDETRRMMDSIEDFRNPDGSLPEFPQKPEDVEWADWVETQEYQRWRAFQKIMNVYEFGGIADLVAFVHLFRWPVIEPDRMADVRTHLLGMTERSRENWTRILAETDDKREWLPAPGQSGIFPRLTVTEERVAGWQRFLDVSDAVLNGEALVPHWRFAGGKGVNIRRLFEEPTTFDPILIAQGAAVLPYLEEGEVVQEDVVAEIGDLIGRGFFAYFVWFN